MSTQHNIAAVIVMSVMGVTLPCFAGRAPIYTERSVEELKLMTTPELARDALLICKDVMLQVNFAQGLPKSFAHKSVEAFNEATRGRKYLERVGLVIRDRQGGQMPAWFEDLSRVVKGLGSPQDCDAPAAAGGWPPKQ